MAEPASAPEGLQWQDHTGRTWAELSDATDLQLDPPGRLALARLAPQTGERVLDVGCGCGQTVLQLAGAVGPTGQVLGVDISDDMLALARARAVTAGARQVDLLSADAASHRFSPAHFDGIFSRFGVMFFERPDHAFANLRAALAPSGRLSFVSWQAMERNPWSLIPLRAVREALPDAPPPAPPGDGPGPFSLGDPGRVGALLAAAGFGAVTIEARVMPIQVGGARTVEEAADYLMRIGPAARLIAGSGAASLPGSRAKIREALLHALAPFASKDGVWLEGAVLVVTARA